MELRQCSLNSITARGADLDDLVRLACQHGFGGVGLWRDVLADAAAIGHLPATTIAEAAGVSRGRVYQLREEQRERMNALNAGRSLAQRRKP